MTREEKVRIAVDMRINGASLREIGERFGVTRQRAEQLLRGTEVEGMFRADSDVRKQEAFAARGRRVLKSDSRGIEVVCEFCGKRERIGRRSAAGATGCRDCNRGGPPSKDITGQVFTYWTVMGRGERPSYWRCRCRCGWEADVWRSNLASGRSKSCHPCGIKRREENRAQRRA